MAVIRGIPFNELKLGLRGINPSVTLPRWAGDDTRIIFFYARGVNYRSKYFYWAIFSTGKKENIAASLHCYTGQQD
jgi:hypothetical protein